jgi:hypothetical protein
MELSLVVRDNGDIVLRAGGQVIGLIDSLSVVVEPPGRLPKVSVRFADLDGFTSPNKSDQELKDQLAGKISEYKRLLTSNPHVEVMGRSKTLPSGMLAVRTSSYPELPEEE